MKRHSILVTICAVAAMAALALCLTACGGTKHTGGVAATVEGIEIPEDKVTDRIEQIRETYGLDDDEQWASYLSMTGMTPETLRTQVLDSFIDEEVEKVFAEQNGITVSDEEVDASVSKMRQHYGSDSEWENALKGAGFTAEDYRESVKTSMLRDKIIQASGVGGTASDDQLLQACQTYAANFDGGKKSSHILFAAEDEAQARTVLDSIKAGTLDFAEAAKQYSTDTGSAADGGNVGWDCLTTFVDEYQTALGKLDAGEVSDLVKSQFGFHIIKCTAVFNAPTPLTSPSQLPDELLDAVKKIADSQSSSEGYDAWLKEFRETLNVVVNDMPANVPYNVKMPEQEAEAAEATAASGTEGEAGSDAEGAESE